MELNTWKMVALYQTVIILTVGVWLGGLRGIGEQVVAAIRAWSEWKQHIYKKVADGNDAQGVTGLGTSYDNLGTALGIIRRVESLDRALHVYQTIAYVYVRPLQTAYLAYTHAGEHGDADAYVLDGGVLPDIIEYTALVINREHGKALYVVAYHIGHVPMGVFRPSALITIAHYHPQHLNNLTYCTAGKSAVVQRGYKLLHSIFRNIIQMT